MAANDYHFVTQWRVEGQVEEIMDIIGDALELPRWWPSVYLDIKLLKEGDKNGIGREIDLYTKGWLPYTLRWQFRVTEVNRPYRLALEARGDFVGTGIWTFEQDGSFSNITYDWKIRADKPFLKTLSFMLKPVFARNHKWAMARGLESLNLELARRRAETPEEQAKIPAPPGPTPRWLIPLLWQSVRG